MARTSLAAAKTELYDLLYSGGAPTVSGVAAVYRYEPHAGGAAKPASLTISTLGMTPDAYLFALRIYVTADIDAKQAQDLMDGLIQAVDAKVASSGGFGPSQWDVTYEADLGLFMAVNILRPGREDPAFR